MNTRIILFVIMTFLFLFNDHAVAFECDNDLIPTNNFPTQYRFRDNRCEGFYLKKVSSGTLNIVGLVKGPFQFKSEENEVINITSQIVNNQPVNVRAVGIPMRMFYRMDACIDPGKRFQWPIKDIVYKSKLSSQAIGVFGWYMKGKEMIYVPVTTTSTPAPVSESKDILLYVRPSTRIRDLQWRFAEQNENGAYSRSTWRNPDMPKDVYPNDRAIQITLPSSTSQTIIVDISARRENNGDWLENRFHIAMNH